MFKIGCHLSITKGFYKTALEAVSIGADTFQFFTRNPRGGKAKELDPEDMINLRKVMEEYSFGPLFAHGSYTMNLCSDKEDVREFALNIFLDDMRRLDMIQKAYYVFHPGSHVGQGRDKAIEYIVSAMNKAVTEDNNNVILLEGMSGKGTEIGGNLKELKEIIDGVKYNKNVGVCLDTCHLHSAGYDVVNDLDRVISDIGSIIGLDRIKAVHLNDNMNTLGCKKDRHAAIGEGSIGIEGFRGIVNHPVLKDLPYNLETPNDMDGYKKEIATIRSLREQ